MNKILILAILIGTSITSAFSQTTKTDSSYVIKLKDDMTNKVYFAPNRNFILSNPESTKGFAVKAHITNDSTFGFITVKMVNIGSCNEKDEIIILFENGEKITAKSWNEFNCEGKAYFDLSGADIQLLRTQPMSKIRITNGRSHDSYTGDVKIKDKRYFIQLFYSLDRKLSSELK